MSLVIGYVAGIALGGAAVAAVCAASSVPLVGAVAWSAILAFLGA